MENAEVAELHAFADEVDVKLYVLSALVVHRIGRYVDHRDVALCHSGLPDRTVELAEQLT